MKPSFFFSILILIAGSFGCNSSTTEESHAAPSDSVATDTVAVTSDTTVTNDAEAPARSAEAIDVKRVAQWPVADFIISCPEHVAPQLQMDIEWQKEVWRDIESPTIATYEGCQLGDYFHLTFKDEHEHYMGLGFGDNNYGDYQLFDDDDFIANPELVNKRFMLHWDWKPSKFPCCQGEFDMVEVYWPSIVKLELIDDGSN